MPAARKRLLLLALDGLSNEQLTGLASRRPGLGGLLKGARRYDLNAEPLVDAQSIWSEILTGRPWFENGCPGYVKPVGSLSSLEVIDEDQLQVPCKLLASEGAVVINAPLVRAKPGRVWLSDGSLPLAVTVSPPDLADRSPFNSYKPRPYPSSAIALSTLHKSVGQCLDVEEQRLSCAAELLKSADWQFFLLRISAFDSLAHLLGQDFLGNQYLSDHQSIDQFVMSLDRFLSEIVAALPDVSVCLLSAFSHCSCKARLNLNAMMEAGGFCAYAVNSPDELALARRAAAAIALSKEVLSMSSPMTSRVGIIDISRSIAASPIAGAVYLNRKDRFTDGVVSTDEVANLRGRIEFHLRTELSREFAEAVTIVSNDRPGIPDLSVFVEGVEYYNLEGTGAVDRQNKPKSTHRGRGFICVPGDRVDLPASAKPVDVLKIVEEVLK